jgi:hypothetical protein
VSRRRLKLQVQLRRHGQLRGPNSDNHAIPGAARAVAEGRRDASFGETMTNPQPDR